MPLYEIQGDVLVSEAQVIVQGLAPGENMPTGIAKHLRDRFRGLASDFKKACRNQRLKPGDFHLWKGPDKWVLNLLTQDEAYSRDVRETRAHEQYLRKALRAVARHHEKLGITSMAMPRICSGLGKMKWEEVRQIIVEEWSDLPIPVFLYVDWRPGQPSSREREILGREDKGASGEAIRRA